MKKTSFIVFLFFSILPTSDKFLNSDNSNSPVYIQLSAVAPAQAETQTGKKQSFKERMCSTITDFLEDKIANTKKNSNTSKILQGSLKEVNGLCGKGIIPQVSEIKGLSPKDKEILNKKTENALKKFYDGAGNLPDEDFDGIKLKSSKTGSGTPGTRLSGDKVSDLKSSDPTLPAANSNPVPALKAAKSGSNPVPKLETSQANASIEPKLQTAKIKGNPEIPKPTQEECDKLEQEGYDKLYQELIQECNKPGEECLKSLKEYQNRTTEAYESWQKCLKLNPYNPACEQLRQKSKELADEENKKREECNKIASEILGCQFEIVQKMTNLVQECAEKKPKPCPEGQVLLPDETCGCPGGQILVQGNCKPEEELSKEERERWRNIEILKSKIIASDKVSPQAVTAAKDAIEEMFKNADPEVVKRLAEKPFKIYIYAKDENPTDMPGFEFLKGQNCNGKPCEEADGITLGPSEGGHIAIPETNFFEVKGALGFETGHDVKGYPLKLILLHELAHEVLFQGLPKGPPWLLPRVFNTIWAFLSGIFKGTAIGDAKSAWNPPSIKRITDLYNQYMKRDERTGLGSKADKNAHENFAHATENYFIDMDFFQGIDITNSEGFSNLQKNQPEMIELLIKIYGPTRSMQK